MTPIHNVRKARGTKYLALLVPASLVPVLLVGITAYPAARGYSMHATLERVREERESLEERRDAVNRFGALEKLDELEQLRSDLRGLVPADLSDIEIFSRFRIAAAAQRVALESIRVQGTRELDLALDGETISMKEVRVTGDSTLDAILGWLDGIRSQGIPTSVSSFSITRARATDPSFRFEAVLGVYHHSSATGIEQSESSE